MIHFDQFGVTAETIRAVLATALAKGADDADLYFEHSGSTSVALSDNKVNRASTHVDLGVGVRVVVGDQVGYAYTEDLSRDAMIAAARLAAEIATGTQAHAPIDVTSRTYADRYPVTMPWEQVELEKRVAMVRDWEQRMFAADPRVNKVEVSLADSFRHVLIARPDGRLVYDYQPMTRAFIVCTAEQEGRRESSSANLAQRMGLEFYTDERVASLIKRAVDDTMILFESGKPPAGEMTVVLGAGSSGILLHEAIGHGLEADFNRKGVSIYADRMDTRIAPKGVTVVDDGTLLHARGSINTDDEGNPAEKTVLIEDGVLRGYLHDEISARHYKVAPTGSGRRESFRQPVLPRMRSTYMEAGPYDPAEIIASVEKGIYCRSFANGQVQIGAGDFAFYVRHGWLIEGGKLTRPIKDVNLVGNGPRVLETIEMVGNDLVIDEGGWTCGKDGQSVPVSQGMPTVKVSRLSVGGAS
ncbi:MAG: metallopeptidase TldD-related protein [Pseudomonadota bacterium]|nr:metallopeptidase TldD-related protein [Pseudomonadota bacterium]